MLVAYLFFIFSYFVFILIESTEHLPFLLKEVMLTLAPIVCRMIERLRKWLSLSESMGDRQRLLNAGKAVASAGGGTAAEPVTNSSEQTKDDTATSNGAESAAEPAAACCQPQRREPVPEGHPHYPLLPMSKGFRLTLRKSLTHLEAALHKLKTGEGPENGAQSDHAEPAPPQSDRLELASS